MKKFIVLYHAPKDAMQQTANMTPEQQEAGMQAWMQWAEKTGSHLVEMGAPLMNGIELHTGGGETSSDRNVSGYSVLQAASLEEAKSLLEGHPHINGWNAHSSIELHETMALPGMEM